MRQGMSHLRFQSTRLFKLMPNCLTRPELATLGEVLRHASFTFRSIMRTYQEQRSSFLEVQRVGRAEHGRLRSGQGWQPPSDRFIPSQLECCALSLTRPTHFYSFIMATTSVDWTWSSSSSICCCSVSIETFSSSTTKLTCIFLIPKPTGTSL